ncbi:MAG: hypothetical protein R3E39_03480 [Anaerolineae bacterium]
MLLYIVIADRVLVTLDRRDVLFPLFSTLAFPPLVLVPFIAMSLRVDGRSRH